MLVTEGGPWASGEACCLGVTPGEGVGVGVGVDVGVGDFLENRAA